MNNTIEKYDSQRLVNLVGYFATPFALFLGCVAVVFTSDDTWQKSLSLGLLGFAAFFNTVFPRFLKQQDTSHKGGNVKFRLYLNLFVNTAVVLMLGDEFKPLWMLLALTPLATAIYGNRSRTLANAATSSVVLLGVQAARPMSTAMDWAEVLVEVAFIILISLLVNGVSALAAHPEKSAQQPQGTSFTI